MKKHIIFISIILFSMLLCIGCDRSLNGFWMDDAGNTLTFGSDGELVINNEVYAEYSISDGNLIIKSNDVMDILPLSSSFTEANDVLILVDQKSQKEYIFYGNEKRQMECRYISGQVDVPEEIYDDALDIFVEKVAPRYEESYDCDFAYFSAGAKRIDGNVCYGVEIRTNSPDAEISNMLGIYFVNIDTEVVYWWDYLANNEVYVDVEEYYTCVEILKDEVEPVYSEKYDDEFVYSLKNDEEVIVWINESPFYWFEVGVSTEEDYFHVDDFAVNPQTEEIYWYDIYGLYDCNYHKWNGKISNGYGI